ncbi:group-specific protein [Jeotgalibacillus salarius]|uniref:Group-specific protein n=1 Tax=Jeotgalibacillus salarius TaxID=546023 RepID=A0A4Y8LHX8_9BACL|nr:group-specific protein [Jeotgalibacillus salarius]TFE02344.1 group-specific protein [Jeotgalibacillus salarius]
MQYIYHMVPKSMYGETLIPLNKMQDHNKTLYTLHSRKYFDHPDRAKLLGRRIPHLNCLWNDVVFFLPMHPNYLYEALKKAGMDIPDNIRFFRIPITALSKNQSVIYTYNAKDYQGPTAEIRPEEVEFLKLDHYQELTELPEDTLNYFKEQDSKERRFGLFHFVPHVMSHGMVDVSKAEVIEWSERTPDIL